MKRTPFYVLGWIVAVVVATVVGLLAVRTVGDTVRAGRPLGQEFDQAVQAAASPSSSPDPAARVVTAKLKGEYGTFTVSCQGPFARGVAVTAAPEWRVVKFDRGPEPDVDAEFVSASERLEVEVFCNAGTPQVAEIEREPRRSGSHD
ncbi:MAG TPA: hypothetical protein VFN19_10795 [Candidatus Nanopelagicales bacterium]|nr:hypothetical protein [Candidatus Nanopelagicales bacterium]